MKKNEVQSLLRGLTTVWVDFESQLDQIPIIQKLNRGHFRLADYQMLLLNMRQQVVEGGCWIARAASNVEEAYFELRSKFLTHSVTEHRDYKLLEENFVSVGGQLEAIRSAPKNIGSEAFSAWMYQRASRPNPFDLLGAMFIIEGLGNQKAKEWGTEIRDQLGLKNEQVSFLLYHGENDAKHMEEFEEALADLPSLPRLRDDIIKCAKVTARLYALQLEELNNV